MKKVLFKLKYWKDFKLWHNLVVMHVENNVFESVLETLLNLKGKAQYHINAHFDLEYMGIWYELHATLNNNGKYLFNHNVTLCYLMINKHFVTF